MQFEMTELEKNVLKLRREGHTFGEIAKILNVNSASQIQSRYSKTLQKLRVLKDLMKYDKPLLRSAEASGFSFNQTTRLYNLLKYHGILNKYKYMTDKDLLEIDGIGKKYLEVLKNAR